MSGDTDAAATPDGPEDGGDLRAPSYSYRGNEQRLDQGLALMGGGVGRDVNLYFGRDDDVSNRIPEPRLREGRYLAEEVRARLYGFVEPPRYEQCRKVLDSHVLILRAGSGTGASTTAFALLTERYGTGGVTGVDSPDDVSDWRPKESRGYVLQGMSPQAAASLSEVALTALAASLRQSGAHLVITVRAEVELPADTVAWQVAHRPPASADVAAKRLDVMTGTGELSADQGAEARTHLTSTDFVGYLSTHLLPGAGVEVADGLRDLVRSGGTPTSLLVDLRAGSVEAAREALTTSRHRADDLALMAAVALLSGQDRTVVEDFATTLRHRLAERGGPVAARAGRPEGTGGREPLVEGPWTQPDLLGPAFEERLKAIGARPLPARLGVAQRYPVQPIVFSGRHRSDALLRCLWLDYEGMAELLWRTLEETPHQSGIELAAGQAIGKVLAHATGPDPLRRLQSFAASPMRWQRRLVAYALGEMAQHPAHTRPVREQLRSWSRAAHEPLRCTVAETCAGSYGLAHPTVALRLLDAVLDDPDKELGRRLRTAVSFALSTLLSENANHPLVLDRLHAWQAAGPGTQRHTMAVHVIESMSLAAFPRPGTPSVRRVRLSDLLQDRPEQALDLVVAALDDADTYAATATGLSLIESDPDLRHRTAFPHFLTALAAMARTHRGVLRFVLRRHRAQTFLPPGGLSS
ncbi:hypothetical protein ACFC09_22405 [Streptomyces sp. NPDC056161]|uniref:hypothetical protein n=1 Tax=Streptomyces sp. NPDC056161 TaxID=3345732 RepID=UPI0035D8964B